MSYFVVSQFKWTIILLLVHFVWIKKTAISIIVSNVKCLPHYFLLVVPGINITIVMIRNMLQAFDMMFKTHLILNLKYHALVN